MAKQTVFLGTEANDSTGTPLREAFDMINDNFDEVYGTNFVTNAMLNDNIVGNDEMKDNAIDHAELAARYSEEVDITDYDGAATFNCSLGSTFKLGDDLNSAYTITLTNYKVGQIITIYPLKGAVTLNLDAGTGTSVFNKIGGVDYEDDGTSDNIIQIECVDDDAADPVFFYSIATYASSKSDI